MLEKEIRLVLRADSEGRLQGKILEAVRRVRGWSQERLAQQLDVDRSTIQLWEREGISKRGYAIAIAELLDVDLKMLTVDNKKTEI